jgi:hypothetical protein
MLHLLFFSWLDYSVQMLTLASDDFWLLIMFQLGFINIYALVSILYPHF